MRYSFYFLKQRSLDKPLAVLISDINDERVVFFFVGKGTEKDKLFNYIKENEFKNIYNKDSKIANYLEDKQKRRVKTK